MTWGYRITQSHDPNKQARNVLQKSKHAFMPAIHKRVWAQSFTYFIEYRIKEENDWTQSTQI